MKGRVVQGCWQPSLTPKRWRRVPDPGRGLPRQRIVKQTGSSAVPGWPPALQSGELEVFLHQSSWLYLFLMFCSHWVLQLWVLCVCFLKFCFPLFHFKGAQKDQSRSPSPQRCCSPTVCCSRCCQMSKSCLSLFLRTSGQQVKCQSCLEWWLSLRKQLHLFHFGGANAFSSSDRGPVKVWE